MKYADGPQAVNYAGVSESADRSQLASGFCSSVDLPQCSAADGSCPTGFACGNAGAAAGSQVCFSTNDSKVPTDYFAPTIAPTAAVTSAPTTTAAATAAPTTKPVTTAAAATTHAATSAATTTAAPATTHAATTTAHPATAAPSAAPTDTPAPTTAVAASQTPATTTVAGTAAVSVCGVGLQACGSACYDPAQTMYSCQNGHLTQASQLAYYDSAGGTTAPTTDLSSVMIISASTRLPTTTTVVTAATISASITPTATATIGISSDKFKTSAAFCTPQQSVVHSLTFVLMTVLVATLTP